MSRYMSQWVKGLSIMRQQTTPLVRHTKGAHKPVRQPFLKPFFLSMPRNVSHFFFVPRQREGKRLPDEIVTKDQQHFARSKSSWLRFSFSAFARYVCLGIGRLLGRERKEIKKYSLESFILSLMTTWRWGFWVDLKNVWMLTESDFECAKSFATLIHVARQRSFNVHPELRSTLNWIIQNENIWWKNFWVQMRFNQWLQTKLFPSS